MSLLDTLTTKKESKMQYPISFIYDEIKNEFVVTAPDLPGCSANCHSMENGFYEMKLAIEDHLSILAEYGEKIPSAQKIEIHQKKLSNKFTDVIWAIIDIDITPYLGKSHKINVTLPELLIKQIDDRVSKSETHKTRSGFIATACLTLLQKNT